MQQLDMYATVRIEHMHAEREAKIARRQNVQDALASRRARLTVYPALLVKVGRQMELMGARLQRRRDDFVRAPELSHEVTWAVQNK